MIRDIQKSTTNGFFISNLILQTTVLKKADLIWEEKEKISFTII
ncbi:hypothetical protein LAC1533_0270 [Ligilactobacillus acidipiscis]|uniref:Uncharacterized protein n=1 Tax=Ligilactobacillus acidipiscis TaxID=89059 RepID=A0A1K1KLG8_9LACO|nr:hypothetical protein LAC1533_0270 [Ligilactobacillus acidipiscis]